MSGPGATAGLGDTETPRVDRRPRPGRHARHARLADAFKEVAERPIPKVPALRGKTVATLFFEPSTRTRLSFETAAKRLSADVMSFTASTSSLEKGESLRDTVETIDAMGVDAMVVRHKSSGVPDRVRDWTSASVVNGGDGQHEHPTQALARLLHDPRGAGRALAGGAAGGPDRPADRDRGGRAPQPGRPLRRARLHGARGRGGARRRPARSCRPPSRAGR